LQILPDLNFEFRAPRRIVEYCRAIRCRMSAGGLHAPESFRLPPSAAAEVSADGSAGRKLKRLKSAETRQ